jgi:hypothetical protein
MKEKVRVLFGIDVRALALFRIGIALLLLWDLFDRSQDLIAHYSDWGVLSRSSAIELMDPWHLSLHMISGTWQIQLFLFLLAGLFAVALLIGYKTRVATICSWILLISLHSRNPLVLQGGDIVLRLLLFWAIFLPLGSYFAFDKEKEGPPSNVVLSLASVGILLQICFIYWFSALLKNDPVWREEGTAVWYAFQIEQFMKPLGLHLLNYPGLLKIFTFSTLILEGFVPFLAFCPFFTTPLRLFALLSFIGFHMLGLYLTMELAHFPIVCSLGWMLFIPSSVWNKIWKIRENFSMPSWNGGRVTNCCAAFFILYILIWNVGTLNEKSLCKTLDCIGSLTRVDQCWNMFAPYPIREDGWYVIHGKLKNGEEIDLLTEKPVTYERPPSLAKAYRNDRWRSYLMNLIIMRADEWQFLEYAQYLTRSWNSSHKEERKVSSFDINFMLKIITPNGPTQPEKINLWEHDCFAEG